MTTWQTLSSMLHLIAIAMWLGAIVFFLAVSGPAVNELAPKLALRTMNRARIGLEAISWFAIGLLLLKAGTAFRDSVSRDDRQMPSR